MAGNRLLERFDLNPYFLAGNSGNFSFQGGGKVWHGQGAVRVAKEMPEISTGGKLARYLKPSAANLGPPRTKSQLPCCSSYVNQRLAKSLNLRRWQSRFAQNSFRGIPPALPDRNVKLERVGVTLAGEITLELIQKGLRISKVAGVQPEFILRSRGKFDRLDHPRPRAAMGRSATGVVRSRFGRFAARR
jgi:hypothetical protein